MGKGIPTAVLEYENGSRNKMGSRSCLPTLESRGAWGTPEKDPRFCPVSQVCLTLKGKGSVLPAACSSNWLLSRKNPSDSAHRLVINRDILFKPSFLMGC